MDDRTNELRDAHDVLADFYVGYLDGHLEKSPIERAVLDLFCELTLTAGLGPEVADVGCGTGRLLPYLAKRGVSPRGTDLSPRMVEVATRDHPGFTVEQADLRSLPYADASLAGVVCWYSLLFLPPEARPVAFGELARVVRPGGYFACAYKNGDGRLRRNGAATTQLGVNFDRYHLSAAEMREHVTAAGFEPVFEGDTPREGEDEFSLAYLVARRG
ncbi:class I SAM-dependent methyltransferase [Actinoplanes solisilvae]|uniref:class I SAM-dependent methyltransferase n=1 Tax=Actinoplanes solisilvae TaxID=2486853 RepID=UPI000FD80F9E|nr:class I SAM-dependent methyltransferase [Actinoplanes solisilvae]